MGIPALFRWLTQKYPKITVPVIEELSKEVDGSSVPVDCTLPNPNGIEFDNLYLDMNGIIHPCCHPEDKPAPKTEDEMYLEIFLYIDRIMRMIRPRKVLYMAIDGVAPRAKMNQQRSRRFRAAQEAQEKLAEEERMSKEWEAELGKIAPKDETEKFDSNCITPGTPFMSRLAVALKYYIADRLTNDPAWKYLKIILSDASIPGEGEHKIMDYIRRQRNCPDYNPHTEHVLYGLDADLIMLALATHETHFHILREDVFFGQKNNRACHICGQEGHMAYQCTGKPKEKKGDFDEKGNGFVLKPYVFLHVNVLREYLEIELRINSLPFNYDFERAIDDYVFLCFFVGNDFLPHLPSLEIREGAIDRLIEIWKKNLVQMGGYITCNGDIELSRVEMLMNDLGKVEDDIFKQRREEEDRRRRIRKDRLENEKRAAEQREIEKQAKKAPVIIETMASLPIYPVKGRSKEDIAESNQLAAAAKKAGVTWGGDQSHLNNANKAAAIQIKAQISLETAGLKRKAVEETEQVLEEQSIDDLLAESKDLDDDVVSEVVVIDTSDKKPLVPDDEEPFDDVRLWEPGWKKRYYKNKFNVDETDYEFRKQVVSSYVQGLCWVLKYYYQGCQSWQWYFPFHYSPFASDFDFVSELKVEFVLGKPFRPFDQLMGVLPAASKKHIPEAFQPLMINSDSEIIDFYPEKFPIDLNGKKYAWQGVALLPFIDEERLLKAVETKYHLLSDEEKQRNEPGQELLWVSASHSMFESVCLLYTIKSCTELRIDSSQSQGMNGFISADPCISLPGSIFSSPFTFESHPPILNHQSISAIFIMPKYPQNYIYEARLLPRATLPTRILDADDVHFVTTADWRTKNKRPRHYRIEAEASTRLVRNYTYNSSYKSYNNEQGNRYSNNDNYRRNDYSYSRNDYRQDARNDYRHQYSRQSNSYSQSSYADDRQNAGSTDEFGRQKPQNLGWDRNLSRNQQRGSGYKPNYSGPKHY